MDLKNLQNHIRTLATLEENGTPVISAYFNLESGLGGVKNLIHERERVLRKTLARDARPAFDEAFRRIESFVESELFPEARGAAIFVRGGDEPFFLPLQFRAPLPNWMTADVVPNIYHLVELKDTYHRYIVLISTEDSARILEVNLGSVTEELWKLRPELRQRVGREWSMEHYQNHRRERTNRFVKEKIQILERIVNAGGHSHIILAGNSFLCARVRAALPKHLQAKLIDTVVGGSPHEIGDVVEATLAAFIEQEEREAHILVETLQREIRTDGLAVVGTEQSLAALEQERADVLILSRTFGDSAIREKLAHSAEKMGVQIEVVNQSEVLMELGGVGCLLRYRDMYEPSYELMAA